MTDDIQIFYVHSRKPAKPLDVTIKLLNQDKCAFMNNSLNASFDSVALRNNSKCIIKFPWDPKSTKLGERILNLLIKANNISFLESRVKSLLTSIIKQIFVTRFQTISYTRNLMTTVIITKLKTLIAVKLFCNGHWLGLSL